MWSASPAQAGTPVTFGNARGERLSGVLHGGATPLTAVSCHGLFAHKDGVKHLGLAALLEGGELGLLRFDFAGCGASAGDGAATTYTSRMGDLAAALDFLAGRGARQFVLFGSSMGGSVALLVAARDERVRRVATWGAVAHPAARIDAAPEAVAIWEQGGTVEAPGGRLGPAFLADSRRHHVVPAAAILRAPVLIAHGEEDEVVPVADAHDLATAARNARLHLVAGADHAISAPALLRPLLREVATFLTDGPEGDRAVHRGLS